MAQTIHCLSFSKEELNENIPTATSFLLNITIPLKNSTILEDDTPFKDPVLGCCRVDPTLQISSAVTNCMKLKNFSF
jgi:hypothetical protein